MPESADASTPDDISNKKRTATGTHSAPAASTSRSSAIPLVALVLSVAALGLAGWAALRSSDSTGSSTADGSGTAAENFTDAQRDEARTKLCAAFDTVRQGVTSNTNASAPGGPGDIPGTLAVAANARLSMFAGGQYLLSRIDPATPEELANEARDFANSLMDIGAIAISGVPSTEAAQSERMKAAQELSITVANQCGQQ